MRLTQFFEQQINKWNTENKCGNCFEFHAPLTEEALNKQKLKNSCCYQVFLTQDKTSPFGKDLTYSSLTNTLSDVWEYKNFSIWFLKSFKLGLNKYNENLNHDVKESISYELENLQECIQSMDLDFCEFVGKQWNITQWRADLIPNRFDNNYTGYRLNITIRKRK